MKKLNLLLVLLALAPLKSYAIGCIGEWPNQICANPDSNGDKPVYHCVSKDRLIEATVFDNVAAFVPHYTAKVTFHGYINEYKNLECKGGTADWPPYSTVTCIENTATSAPYLALRVEYFAPSEIHGALKQIQFGKTQKSSALQCTSIN